MQRNIESVGKRLQVIRTSFVFDIFHTNMYGFDLKVWSLYFSSSGQHFQQTKRILTTRQTNQDIVSVIDKIIIGKRFTKATYDFSFQFLFVCWNGHGHCMEKLFQENKIDGCNQ